MAFEANFVGSLLLLLKSKQLLLLHLGISLQANNVMKRLSVGLVEIMTGLTFDSQLAFQDLAFSLQPREFLLQHCHAPDILECHDFVGVRRLVSFLESIHL
jgi:hypothetical protein